MAEEAVEAVEKRAAGVLGMAGEDALDAVREDDELWALIVERELAWSKSSTMTLALAITYLSSKERRYPIRL